MSRKYKGPRGISHKQIMEYWKTRAISKEGNVYIDHGYEGCDEHLLGKVETEPVIVDWGEPCCFACGRPVDTKIYDMYDFENLEKLWTTKEVTSTLNKCHIVPDSLGGKTTANNLFLMCPKCHREAPDTIYPSQFFKWVYRKRQYEYNGGLIGEVLKELKQDYGIKNPELLVLVLKNNWLSKIGLHGGNVKQTSVKAALIGLVLERELETRMKKGVNDE